MAKITISNLKPNGYELFSDSESYMMDLSENELSNTQGGITPTIFAALIPGIASFAISVSKQF